MDDNRNFNQDWEDENQGEQAKKSRKFALKWNKDKNRNSNSKEEIKSSKKGRKTKAVIAVVLVVVVAAGAVFTFRSKGKKAQASGSRVMESKVQKGNLSRTVEGTGTLANADATDLKIPVGLKIRKVKVSEGDEVKKGDTLATVDKTSLLSALAETQEELDDVNKQLGDEADSDTSKYVESSVDGRVKKIYASKNTDAANTVLEKGALMLISLDGKMAVKMDTSVSLTVGQEVKVVLSSGSSVTGTVTKAEDESCTITVTDNGTKYNDKVTAYTSSGTKIGIGKLYINKEARVTATSGMVSSILVSENEAVSEGDNLIKLKGDFQSEEYLSLESEKEDLEEKLTSLLKIAKNNTITADSSGIITAVNVSEDTESGSVSESSSSGSSSNSSGTGSSGTATATGMSAVKTTNTVTATGMAAVKTTSKETAAESTAVKTTSTATETSAVKTTNTATETAEAKTTSIPTATAISTIKTSNMIKAVRLSTNSDIATQNASEITAKEKNEAGTTESSSKKETNKNTGSAGSQTSGSQTGESTANGSQNGNSESSGTGNSTTDSSQTGNTGNSGTDSSQTGSSTENSSQSSSSNTSNSSSNKNTASGSDNTTTKNTTGNKTTGENSNGTGNSSGTNSQNSASSGNTSGASGTMNGSKSGAGGMSGFSGSAAGSAGAMAGSASGNSTLSGTSSESTSTTTSSTDTNTELTSAFGIALGDEMTISVSIDEMDILSVETGQKATITFDAIENKEYEGEITSIDKNGTTSNGTTKYPVEITVTKEDSMMSGMNASVTITTSEVSDALLIPAAAVTEEGNTSYVYTQKDSKSGELSGKTEVQTGDTDGTNIVITSGLSEGDTVYYSMSAGDSSDKNSDSADNQDKQNMKMNGSFGGGRGGNGGGNPPSGDPGGND